MEINRKDLRRRKIILCGKGASGKTLFQTYMRKMGYKIGISYTTRPIREGEEDGVTYHYVENINFDGQVFYEKMEFNGWKYGTLLKTWNESEVFIMTPSAINSMSYEDRKECYIVYFDISEGIRKKRLNSRGDVDGVNRRLKADYEDFKDFDNYNMRVSDSEFNCDNVLNKILKDIDNVYLFLDVDGICADFNKHFLDYLNIEDKTPAKSWEDSRFKDNWKRIENDEKFWLTIPPMKGVKSLNFYGYCTARPISNTVTREWMKKNNFPNKPIINVGVGGSKVKDLKRVGCELFVDDAIHNFEEINKSNIPCLLMTRSHNINYIVNENKRINKLGEIKKYMLSLKQ